MSAIAVNETIAMQRGYFAAGHTLPLPARRAALEALRTAVRNHEAELMRALLVDLGKNEIDAYTTEIGFVYAEIRHAQRHLRRWTRARRVRTDLHNLPGRSRVYPSPYGVCAILAPWNYPVQLALAPLVAALAAGNTAIVKPSETTPRVAAALEVALNSQFAPELVRVVNGDAAVAQELVGAAVDKIFFTGSVPAGRTVMRAAAERLTPVTLELGGKSPVVIDASAELAHAAKKIAWGKFLNAGQTCVAPDYLLVERSVAEEFVRLLTTAVASFFGPNPADNAGYGRIVNERHVDRLSALLPNDGDRIRCGGTVDRANRFFAPTVVYPADWNDSALEDEIFGPILPVVVVDSFTEALTMIDRRPKPLAAYLFTRIRAHKRLFLEHVRCGGVGINTVVLHVASTYLPFGGVGPSGHGSYHGRAGFDEFTHFKSVLEQFPGLDPGLAYPGRTPSMAILRRIME